MQIEGESGPIPVQGPECKKCFHCDLPIPKQDLVIFQEHSFCCHGCKTVFQILKENSLDDFYRLRALEDKSSESLKNRRGENFSYLDEEEFRERYFPKNINGQRQGSFYVEGVHCHACLWLLEKMPQLNESVKSAQFHFGRLELKVLTEDHFQFSELAKNLFDLGYKVSALEANSSTWELAKQENKKWLYRIGVAAACQGNIMLFAVSSYAGADETWRLLFDKISGGLFLPVLLYSAYPLYRSAMGALKAKMISIDLPLVFAILFGGLLSYFHLFTGSSEVYFDSLTTLVFLILSSRYFLRVVQQRNQLLLDREIPFTKSSLKVWNKNDQSWQLRNIDKIQIGDRIHWPKGEILAVDGILSKSTIVDTSLITGESHPQTLKADSEVLAGSKNLKTETELMVTKAYADGVLGKLLGELKSSWRSYRPYQGLTDRLAKYLLYTIFITSGLVILNFSLIENDWQEGLNRALALLIIACPCALGIGAPLIFTLSLKNLFKKKIFVKSGQEIEKLFKLKNVFFDKTGTLTLDKLQVENWEGECTSELAETIYNIEELSSHPFAQSLCQYIEDNFKPGALEVSEFCETLGLGVSAIVNQSQYEIGKYYSEENGYEKGEIGVFKDKKQIAKIKFKQYLNPVAKKMINWLKKKKANIYILTGDEKEIALENASELGIRPSHVYAHCLPQDKKEIIEKYQPSIMVGDGLNDGLALSYADVGIGIKGGIPLKVKDANINIEEGGLKNVYELFFYVQKIKFGLLLTLAFSLSFNLSGILLASLGFIDPLGAAILMPISSLIVLGLSFYTTKMRAQFY